MNGNANGNLAKWMLGAFFAVLMAGGSGFIGSTYNQVRQHGERIVVLEYQSQALQQRLQRIESKLDQLLRGKNP